MRNPHLFNKSMVISQGIITAIYIVSHIDKHVYTVDADIDRPSELSSTTFVASMSPVPHLVRQVPS